jgi:hypothetical protein
MLPFRLCAPPGRKSNSELLEHEETVRYCELWESLNEFSVLAIASKWVSTWANKRRVCMLKLFPVSVRPPTAPVNICMESQVHAHPAGVLQIWITPAFSWHDSVWNQFPVVIEGQLLTKLTIFICSSRNCGINANSSHSVRLRMHFPEFETSPLKFRPPFMDMYELREEAVVFLRPISLYNKIWMVLCETMSKHKLLALVCRWKQQSLLDFRLPQRWLWRVRFPRLWRYVVRREPEVSEENITSIFKPSQAKPS